MTEFVLVAGTWLAAAAWDEVAAELRSALRATGGDHEVHALTLSGLADKQGIAAGQQTHVADIVDAIDGLGLRDVVLVGHSYAGIPVGQAAERIGARLNRVVFVDANVPVHNESFVSGWPDGRSAVEASIAAHDGSWPPLQAADFEGQGLTDDQIARIVVGSTPHPGATLTEPAVLTHPLAELPATYVKCLLDGVEPHPAVAKLLATAPDWQLTTLNTGHWPMFSAPSALARVLLDAAAQDTPPPASGLRIHPVHASSEAALRDWQHVHNAVIPTALLSLEEVRERSARHVLHIAHVSDTLVGCMTVRPPAPGSTTATATATATVIARVLPAYRGRGFGRELYAYGLAQARDLGAEVIETVVLASNPEGLDFARRAGFTEVDRYVLPGDTVPFVDLRLT